MKRIGLLSDTHGTWDDRYLTYFAECDEVWHAGDIVSLEVADKFEAFKPIRFVYGNADGQAMRLRYPKDWKFTLEGVTVWLTHIGGYPGHYPRDIYWGLQMNPPKLFVCGHSHILKVMYDHALHTLVVNPGAAGTYGQQTVRTLMRFTLDSGQIKDMEVIELK
jgi:hypothetical protein